MLRSRLWFSILLYFFREHMINRAVDALVQSSGAKLQKKPVKSNFVRPNAGWTAEVLVPCQGHEIRLVCGRMTAPFIASLIQFVEIWVDGVEIADSQIRKGEVVNGDCRPWQVLQCLAPELAAEF